MSKQQELDQLLQQTVIVSTMMLAVTRGFHGDYRRKHVGAMWEELLVAFVLWQNDTMLKPMTVLGIANVLGIPRSNAGRALDALIAQGIACKVKRRYGRNVDFISARPSTRFFTDVRVAVIKAGRELERVFGT